MFIPEIMTGVFLALLACVILLNIFGLPGNWVLFGLVVAWKYLYPGMGHMDALFFGILIALGLLGEALEFGSQIMKAKQYGSSKAGTFMGIVGALVGAILMAPLFFGLGALLGALIGAFAGSYLAEIINSRPHAEAMKSAFGAMTGRFLGTVSKCAIGLAMLVYTAKTIWPESSFIPLPPTVPGKTPVVEEVLLMLRLCA